MKKGCESRFPYCFLTDFTKFFFWGSALIDFGFFTEEASWIHRILKFDVTVKKNKKIQIRLKFKSPPIFTKFSFKHHSVLVYSRTEFQLDESKFAWVRQLRKNSQKIQNLKKFERFNRFWPNSIPKFLDGCNTFVCSFRTLARILRKLKLARSIFKKFKIP